MRRVFRESQRKSDLLVRLSRQYAKESSEKVLTGRKTAASETLPPKHPAPPMPTGKKPGAALPSTKKDESGGGFGPIAAGGIILGAGVAAYGFLSSQEEAEAVLPAPRTVEDAGPEETPGIEPPAPSTASTVDESESTGLEKADAEQVEASVEATRPCEDCPSEESPGEVPVAESVAAPASAPASSTTPAEEPAAPPAIEPTAPAQAEVAVVENEALSPAPAPVPAAEPGADVSPQVLVTKALQEGAEMGEDWAKIVKAMQYQAEMDKKAFDAELARHAAKHEAEMQSAKLAYEQYVATSVGTVKALEQALDVQRDHSAKMVRQLEIYAEEERNALIREKEDALEEQKLRLEDELAEEANKERIDRAEQLDGLRLQVNALEDVLSRRWQERKGSVDAHNLAGAVMAVESSMNSGKGLGPAVLALAGKCEGDVLVHAAIDSLPPSVHEHGVMSKAQLLESLEEVKPAARELVLIPSGSSAGPLSMVVARVAAAMRVREDPGSGGSIESTLARVQGLLAADEIVAAAAELEDACKGTAAAPIVGEWVKAARERALLDQTLSVLQAQAITLTAAYTSQ